MQNKHDLNEARAFGILFGNGDSTQCLRIVDRYVHLGSIFDRSGASKPASAGRTIKARLALNKVGKRFLCAPSIDLADKQRLIALLIHSTMLYAAETWSWSRTQQIADLKTIANKAARMSLGKNKPLDRVSDDLLITYGFIDISVFARLKRLRYFSAVLKHGPSQLRALMQVQKQGKNCWREALIGDIAWARERMPECDEFPELSVDPVFGENFIASRRWKGFLKQLKSRIADCSVSAGGSHLSRSIVELDDERETFTCEECGIECRGIAKYKSHLVSKHRFRSIEEF